MAYVALGANLGDRLSTLRQAVRRLEAAAGVRVTRVASLYESRAVGGPAGQPPYLNSVVALRTTLTPGALLAILHEAEHALGRIRRAPNDPRTIDLDLLLYDELVLASDDVTVPHPRLQERLFVLLPLAELAGAVVHPRLGQPVADLLAAARAPGGEEPLWVAGPEWAAGN